MVITKNLKPLKPTGNESKEELLDRLVKYTKWFEETKEKLEKDCEEEVANARRRQEYAENQLKEQWRNHECSDTVDNLKRQIENLESRLDKIHDVMYDYDDYD